MLGWDIFLGPQLLDLLSRQRAEARVPGGSRDAQGPWQRGCCWHRLQLGGWGDLAGTETKVTEAENDRAWNTHMGASSLVLYAGLFGEECFIKTSVDFGVNATHILEPKLNLV